ncbi:MFS transporter [Paenibacillus sp. Marseille-Q4541]|uniref:MDR family MFS transporter n=1 Tax=Paenibacillus sp. Marseille-Q4541 TaxID=2831522 RepID=UPI001BAC1FFE|nr:MFS transporter [Paenibacillus sp. Marseille-Q4541]
MNKHMKEIHPLAWTIIVGTIFGRMATSMSIPFLSIYLIKTMGASPAETGIVVAVSSLIGVFASFYGGYISDRIGRRKVLLFSIFSWAIVFIGFAAANQIWIFFVMNALNGLCRAVFEPTSRAMLSDITKPENKLLVFNLRYAAINLGVVIGPLIGLQMGSAQTGVPFIAAGAVYILYGLVLVVQFAIRPEPSKASSEADGTSVSLKEAFTVTSRDRTFMYVLLGSIFCVLGYGHFSSTLAQFLELSPRIEDGTKWFTYMLSMNAVVVLIVQYPLVRMFRNFPPAVSLIVGNVFVTASLILFGIFDSWWAMMAGVVIFTIGEVLIFTLMDLLVDRIAKPELKGTYFGMIGFNNMGNVLAPLIGGSLLTGFSAEQPLYIFIPIALMTACGIPFLLLAHLRLKEQAQSSVSNHTIKEAT